MLIYPSHQFIQRNVPLVRELLKRIDGFQGIKSPLQQFAQRNALFIRGFVKSLDRLWCRLGVELLVAPVPVDARLASGFFRLFRLPAWQIVLPCDAFDRFFLDSRFFFRFGPEGRWLFQSRKGIDASGQAAPATF